MSFTDSAPLNYCASRFQAIRRVSSVVKVGSIAIGGDNPLRVQSMTTTNTQDINATVRQTLALVEAGCEIVRITAPNKKAAQALAEISKNLRSAKCDVPLVADVHFLPSAAMEAAKHVEKVRINPGNYADKKKFTVNEYSDVAYNEELERLYESVSPIIKRCKKLGRAMRIGTNHGSLSDRIMNRYGDTPLGMVESALEFIRIAESHSYYDICLSMKASNPKVMIQAYRLAVARMQKEDMHYPLHLGVTEAGDGEDARIKSAIGIGALLNDGLGDTLRVSLTEDPIYEIPVARDLANKAMDLWKKPTTIRNSISHDSIDPYHFNRRTSRVLSLGPKSQIGGNLAPAIVVKSLESLSNSPTIIKAVCRTQTRLKDSPLEGLQVNVESPEDLVAFIGLHEALHSVIQFFVLEIGTKIDLSDMEQFSWPEGQAGIIILQKINAEDAFYATELLNFCRFKKFNLAIDCSADALRSEIGEQLRIMGSDHLIISSQESEGISHPLGHYRELCEAANNFLPDVPIWIRNTKENTLAKHIYFSDRLIESSMFSGALLCDGIGDIISIETEPVMQKGTALAYNILQGARSRISKTEFVACPSCGRTLFDLQSVTQTIRARTDHLKGVTIAIMGCIVNGPGEMADADFGYVGGAPNKINLYVGKECVEYNVHESEALNRLIELIKKNGKWVDPT